MKNTITYSSRCPISWQVIAFIVRIDAQHARVGYFEPSLPRVTQRITDLSRITCARLCIELRKTDGLEKIRQRFEIIDVA